MTKDLPPLSKKYGFTGSEMERFPIISGILEELTPEKIEREIALMREVQLPENLREWIKKYEKVGSRGDFIWKWTYVKAQGVTLTSVPLKNRKDLLIPKVLTIIINVLADDIADKKKDETFLRNTEELFFSDKEIACFAHLAPEHLQYLKTFDETKEAFWSEIKKYPRYENFRKLLLYDYRQFFNALSYSCLVNKNVNFMNFLEHKIYLSHNMQMMILTTIDLMASPSFKEEEVGLLREISWLAQRMGRIGNSITTFRREIQELDFSSDVFAYLASSGLIKRQELRKLNAEDVLEGEKKALTELFAEWEQNYHAIKAYEDRVSSFEVKELLTGLKSLMEGHLISETLK